MCVVMLLCKQLVGTELPVSQAVVVVVASISSSVDPWQAARGQWGGGSCPSCCADQPMAESLVALQHSGSSRQARTAHAEQAGAACETAQ